MNEGPQEKGSQASSAFLLGWGHFLLLQSAISGLSLDSLELVFCPHLGVPLIHPLTDQA